MLAAITSGGLASEVTTTTLDFARESADAAVVVAVMVCVIIVVGLVVLWREFFWD